jgi:hypothetical protein
MAYCDIELNLVHEIAAKQRGVIDIVTTLWYIVQRGLFRDDDHLPTPDDPERV